MIELTKIKQGQSCLISKIPNSLYQEFLRLGLCEGDTVRCISHIPYGPVVLEKDLLELAIGHKFAKEIFVNVIHS